MRRKKPTRSHASQESSAAPDVTRDAEIVGVFGATGSGKSAYLKRCLLARPAGVPCVIFDPGEEYSGRAFYHERAFIDAAAADPSGGFAYVLRPSREPGYRLRQFDRFCRLALLLARRGRGCLVVADELHLVNNASTPPAGWRELIETGRKWGVRAWAASIRPALIDKTFWTCATRVRSGRLNYREDCATVAGPLGVKPDELAALTGTDYLERDLLTGASSRGTLTF